MDKHLGHDRPPDKHLTDGDRFKKDDSFDDTETPDRNTDPHLGEDPGLLESTEDPRERRLKRNTM